MRLFASQKNCNNEVDITQPILMNHFQLEGKAKVGSTSFFSLPSRGLLQKRISMIIP